MEQQFDVGDKVRIKFRDHSSDDYKFQFTDEMARLSGKIYTIRAVAEDEFNDSYEVEDDNCRYFLEEEPADHFTWSSGMLEYVEKMYEDESEIAEDKKNIKSKIRKILYSSITEDYDKVLTTTSSIIRFDYPIWADPLDFQPVANRSTRR